MSKLFKSIVNANYATRVFFCAMIDVAARLQSRVGHLYRALDLYCRAYRSMPSSDPSQRRFAAIKELTRAACFKDGRVGLVSDNRFLQQYDNWPDAKKIRVQLGNRSLDNRVRLRKARSEDDPARQGCLFVWKEYDPETGERGVILLKYLYSFAEMPAIFDMKAIARHYRIVLEPSWTNYFEAPFFLYIGSDLNVVIQCTQRQDAHFFEQLGVGFRTVQLGGGDWVDFDLFKPTPNSQRDFDIVMNAGWVPWKRHRVLFRALRHLAPRKFRVALIGGGDREGRQTLETEMQSFQVRDQCEVFEGISAAEVATIVARSKMALLLSKLEGTNKGIHEALFCDTPIIVYRHHLGLNMELVNEMTGVLADEDELAEAILRMIESSDEFRPRDWALLNTGYKRSTEAVNGLLQEIAAEHGEPWTRDLVYKTNRPHSQYKFDEDRIRFEPAYGKLADYLRQ